MNLGGCGARFGGGVADQDDRQRWPRCPGLNFVLCLGLGDGMGWEPGHHRHQEGTRPDGRGDIPAPDSRYLMRVASGRSTGGSTGPLTGPSTSRGTFGYIARSMDSIVSMTPSILRTACGAAYTAGMSTFALTRVAFGDGDAVHRMTSTWHDHLCRMLRVEVLTEGAERLNPETAYVVVANHQSIMDVVALYEALPMKPGFIAKQELRRIPIFGRAIAQGGHVFIDRSTRRKAVEAIHGAAEQVRARNITLVIFPEGTRTDGKRVGPFKSGAFRLAKLTGVPVVPVGIRGTAAVLGKHQRRVRPGRIHVRIGEPLAPEVVQSTPTARLSELVRTQIAELAELPLGTQPSD